MKCATCQGFGRVALPMLATMVSPGVSVGYPVHREGPCPTCGGSGEAGAPTNNAVLSDDTCKSILKKLKQARFNCHCGCGNSKVYLQPRLLALPGVDAKTGEVLDAGLCCVAAVCDSCGSVLLLSAELLGVEIGDAK